MVNTHATSLGIGDQAPAFELATDGGGQVSSHSLTGRWIVLYFYPKDDTPGCTKEAVAFTERAAEFDARGATIVGVSKDSVEKHDKFKAKHGLSVILASDPDGAVIEAFGVWVEKNMYGRKMMGIERATYLIDPDGVVRAVWRKVRVPGHVDAVYDALADLTA